MVKASYQSLSLAKENNVHCFRGYQLIKTKESKDQKDFETMKTPNSHVANQSNSRSGGHSDQFGQVLG